MAVHDGCRRCIITRKRESDPAWTRTPLPFAHDPICPLYAGPPTLRVLGGP